MIHHHPLEMAFKNGRSTPRLVVVSANTTTLVAPANDKRIALYIWPCSGTGNVSNDPNMTAVNGIQVFNVEPLKITQWQFGDWATTEFWTRVTIAQTLYVVEVFGDCNCETGHGDH